MTELESFEVELEKENQYRVRLASIIPISPNNYKNRKKINDYNLVDLLIIFLNWRSRFIEQKPRKIKFSDPYFEYKFNNLNKDGIKIFRERIIHGGNLNIYLSNKIKNNGFVFGESVYPLEGADKDAILLKYGYYHFHVGPISANGKVERQKNLLFGRVFPEEVELLFWDSHDAFKKNTTSRRLFLEKCDEYFKKSIKQNGYYTLNPTTVSGHSSVVTDHAIYYSRKIRFLERSEKLKETLYQEYRKLGIELKGKVKLKWEIHNMNLLLKDNDGNSILVIEFGSNFSDFD